MSGKKVLILGANGMLGNSAFRSFLADTQFQTRGTIRSANSLRHFTPTEQDALISDIDVTKDSDLISLFGDLQPEIVINCVGVIKQHDAVRNHLTTMALNAMLPHRLAQMCRLVNARLVHISTDCVFSGKRGNYTETDFADADDLYGRTKYLGEVSYDNCVTLRTSIIGHELNSSRSLINWFLSQQDEVQGFKKAVFSGLPTVEIAQVIQKFVIPNPELSGLYHLSADPINKHDLLSIVANIYGKPIRITPNESYVIDRSLDSTRFQKATGYRPAPWPDLITSMHQDYLSHHAPGQ